MVSLRARFVYDLLMPLLGTKRRYRNATTAEALRARARAPASPPARTPGVAVRKEHCQGRVLYRLTPTARAARHHLFYLHGGAFVNPITGHHWAMLTDLCRRLDAEIVVPFYPLAPDTAVDAMIPVVEAIYDDVAGAAPMVLMGDSAGAWLALALAQRLRDRAMSANPALVLISPCLDLNVADPRSKALDRRDPMLDLADVRRVLMLATGPRPVDDPALDRLRCGVGGLPPMQVLAAERDLLSPDSARLLAAVEAAGGVAERVDGVGMAHVWPVLPVPEAAAARRAIASFIERHGDPASLDG